MNCVRTALTLLAVAATLVLGGCGSSNVSSGPTRLRVDVVSALWAASDRTITCDGTGGASASAAAICAGIRKQPQLARAFGGREHSCPAGTPTVFVSGSTGGRPVQASFSACVAGEETLSARWLSMLDYPAGKSVACSTRTLTQMESRSTISPAERSSVEQALKTIPELTRQGVRCGTARARSRSADRHARRATAMLQLGSSARAVRALQSELARLTYLPSSAVNGVFDMRTWHAVVAFQGWSGIARDGIVGPHTRAALAHARPPTPWSTADGIEVHIPQQVLLLVRGGRVVRAIHVSTGMPGWPTPVGHFTILSRDLMAWSIPFQVWMPLAQFFYTGYAIHEFPDVPDYPASHGCVRVPSEEAPTVWQFGRIGMRVWTVA